MSHLPYLIKCVCFQELIAEFLFSEYSFLVRFWLMSGNTPVITIYITMQTEALVLYCLHFGLIWSVVRLQNKSFNPYA